MGDRLTFVVLINMVLLNMEQNTEKKAFLFVRRGMYLTYFSEIIWL